MKKTLSVLSFLALAIALPASVAASTPTVEPQVVNGNVEVRANLDTRAENREARQASSTERRIELQQSVVKRLAAHAGKILNATIERLEKIMTRVESRIAKVKAEGGVTTESEKFVAEAKVHLSEAKAELALFSSVTLSADKLSENILALRAASGKVKTHLKAAHASLVKATVALKPGRSVNATSTTSVSN